MSIPHLLTADELERISIPGKVVELVRGRLVAHEPPGTYHGAIAAKLAYFLGDFAQRHGSGTLFTQDTGFKVGSNPDTVRAPDVAYPRDARYGLFFVRSLPPLHSWFTRRHRPARRGGALVFTKARHMGHRSASGHLATRTCTPLRAIRHEARIFGSALDLRRNEPRDAERAFGAAGRVIELESATCDAVTTLRDVPVLSDFELGAA